MNERHSQINDPHQGTFDWIFEYDPTKDSSIHKRGSAREYRNPHLDAPWDDFGEYLKSADVKLYWISGKPGSGKSTLMKSLAETPRTLQRLNEGFLLAGSESSCVIVSYFIWAAGTAIQKSLRGMLASLLYQVLQGGADHYELALQCQRFPVKKHFSDWSEKELTETLISVCRYLRNPLCYFLDGLDEMAAADIMKLLRVIDGLCISPRTKCVVSSRPERIFSHRFKDQKTMRMQDLTMRDIRRYSEDLLRPFFEDPCKLKSAVDMLCYKAEGVFLWVVLAVKGQQLGVLNMDDPEEIVKRLELLPNEINDLYYSMWRRLNEDTAIYAQDAARYFNLLATWMRMEKMSNFNRDHVTVFLAAVPDLLEGVRLSWGRDRSRRDREMSRIEGQRKSGKQSRKDQTTQAAK
ncbi:hypothetical protein EsH8_I_000208 [Colletotrichum jinshuiense]